MAVPSLTLTTYDAAPAFRDRVQPFLLRQEAANNLILGLISGLVDTPRHFPEAPFLAAVEEEGEVVVVFMCTPPHRLIVSTCDQPAALALAASTLTAANRDFPGITGPIDLARTFANHWQAQTGRGWNLARALRVFAVQRVRPVPGVSGSLRRASLDDHNRLIDWFSAFAIEADIGAERDQILNSIASRLDNKHGGIWLWEVDETPVCLVGAGGVTPHGIRIGPVYTPTEHRRSGYASAATAAVSQHLLDSGRAFVFLFTDLTNSTANHIYQTIGYQAVCDNADIEFLAQPAPG